MYIDTPSSRRTNSLAASIIECAPVEEKTVNNDAQKPNPNIISVRPGVQMLGILQHLNYKS